MFENIDGDRTLNFMKVKNGIMIHKQLERRNNKLFFRMKRRPFIVVSDKSAS